MSAIQLRTDMEGNYAASILKELQDRFGYTSADVVAHSTTMGPQFALGHNWLSNIRNKSAVPDIRRIYALGEIFRLQLGDLLALFDFPPGELLTAKSLINADKTRLIEHRITDVRNCSVPSLLSSDLEAASTRYMSQLINEWRTTPTSRLRRPGWLNPRIFYAKLGVRDSNAAPRIPPGSWLQVLRTRERHHALFSPTAIYLVQHTWGMTACRCTVQAGFLYLHSQDPSYSGPFRLKLRVQARVLGQVTAFAAALPSEPYQRSNVILPRSGGASPIAPWEFQRPNDLFLEQYRRYGMHRREFDRAAGILAEKCELQVSVKYVEELHSSQHFPRTSTAIALSILTATRLSDLFSSAGTKNIDRERFQLDELLAMDCRNLPPVVAPAPAPQPPEVWNDFVKRYREWPLLFCNLITEPTEIGRRILRFEHSGTRRGLNASVMPFSFSDPT